MKKHKTLDFDAARKALHATGQPEKVVQDAVAWRIIAAARKGERDFKRLRNAAWAGLRGTTHAVDE